MNLTLFLIYGVHGDEAKFGKYIALYLRTFLEEKNSFYNIQVRLLGPYSKWSSRHFNHFTKGLADPNRQHTKVWNSCKTDLRSLIVAKTIYQSLSYDSVLNVDNFLRQCNDQGVNISNLSTSPQIIFSDFLGYINYRTWKIELNKRKALEQKIKKLIVERPKNSRYIFFDIHAGIGQPGKVSIIYRTNRKLVADHGCYLVDGLARDLDLPNADYYVLEAGLKGTKVMLKKIILDFHNKSRNPLTELKSRSILDTSEYLLWKKAIKIEIESRFPQIFEMVLTQFPNP